MMPALTASTLGDNQTIAALATPSGKGALAMVRVSGAAAGSIASRVLHPAPNRARHATHCSVIDATGTRLDDAVATLFLGPASFTGEDMLEISTHGGMVVPVAVLSAIITAGARQAEPGEFTRRAVLNGKLDLLQAEAIGDLIDARSSAGHHQALRQLDGGLSRRVGALRQQLLTLEAMLAYDIDFPEEDDGPVPHERIMSTAMDLQRALAGLLASGGQGILVHEGALVVIAGAPNVGKSSLFNALLGEARAIVTSVPGTTRDAIEAVLDLPGWPLRLVDTAGLRETQDIVEQFGIEVSTRYLSRAELVIACVDSSEALQQVATLRTYTAAPVITVATKCDLVSNRQIPAQQFVSANTGEGLHDLLHAIEQVLVSARGSPVLDAPVLTRVRHRVAVERAGAQTQQFVDAWQQDALPASIAATHVRAAAEALSELIGVVRVDDVLEVVFRNFCVGK